MKKLLILCILLLSTTLVFAAGAKDRRISDDDGDVLNINSDGTLPVSISGDVTLENGELIDNSTDGTICLQGAGGTNNEDICFGLESISNEIVLDSNTSATRINSDFTMRFSDNIAAQWGGGSDALMLWTDVGNDNLQLAIGVGSAADSGYFSLMEYADRTAANRSPSGTSANPVLRVYSSDATEANDYIEMYHDQGKGIITVGTGSVTLNANSNGKIIFQDGGSSLFNVVTDAAGDQSMFATEDVGGNQIIITNDGNSTKDHDHATQTNPTVYIQSDTDPDTDNQQWGSLSHDQTDFIITGDAGDTKITDNLVVTGLIVTAPYSGDPCTAAREGAIFWNTSANELCVCDGTNDVRIKDASTACY